MPIHLRADSKGYYYQYGNHGKKYYFKSEKGRESAYRKAHRQAIAIKISQKKRYKT